MAMFERSISYETLTAAPSTTQASSSQALKIVPPEVIPSRTWRLAPPRIELVETRPATDRLPAEIRPQASPFLLRWPPLSRAPSRQAIMRPVAAVEDPWSLMVLPTTGESRRLADHPEVRGRR